MAPDSSSKECKVCGLFKPQTDFYRHSGKTRTGKPKSGYSTTCKRCTSAAQHARYVERKKRLVLEGPTVAEKRCRDCEEVKPASSFYWHAGTTDGIGWVCKDCQKVQARVSALADPERTRARTRKAGRKSHLMKSYGLTVAEFEAMVEAQGGRCGICDQVPDQLVVDHDHETGEIRGLLCSPCNSGVGLLRDDPEVVDRAAAYLRRHKASRVQLKAVE